MGTCSSSRNQPNPGGSAALNQNPRPRPGVLFFGAYEKSSRNFVPIHNIIRPNPGNTETPVLQLRGQGRARPPLRRVSAAVSFPNPQFRDIGRGRMKAEEVIPATHRLEHSGMARNEAEAVISELQKVVAPLATKDGVAKLERSIARLEQSMATKDDLEKLRQTMTTKADVAEMETRLFRSLAAIMLGTGLFILSVLRFFPPS